MKNTVVLSCSFMIRVHLKPSLTLITWRQLLSPHFRNITTANPPKPIVSSVPNSTESSSFYPKFLFLFTLSSSSCIYINHFLREKQSMYFTFLATICALCTFLTCRALYSMKSLSHFFLVNSHVLGIIFCVLVYF